MNEKAFPNQLEMIDHVTYREVIKGGMDLRDYFAAKALQGIMNQDPDTLFRVFSKTGQTLSVAVSEMAYTFADAMLKTRKETK